MSADVADGATLPEGFNDLAIWVDSWVLRDSQARSERRQACTIDQLRAFYDALLPRAEAALAHLAQFQLGALPAPEERLLKLMLSLAEVGPAVEWYGQAGVVDGLDAARFPALQVLPDTAPQKST